MLGEGEENIVKRKWTRIGEINVSRLEIVHSDKEFNAIVWPMYVLQLEILIFVLSLPYWEWLLTFVRGKLAHLLRQDKIAKIASICVCAHAQKLGPPKYQYWSFVWLCESFFWLSEMSSLPLYYVMLAIELQHLAVMRALLTSSCNFCHHVSLDLTHRRLSILDWHVGKTHKVFLGLLQQP